MGQPEHTIQCAAPQGKRCASSHRFKGLIAIGKKLICLDIQSIKLLYLLPKGGIEKGNGQGGRWKMQYKQDKCEVIHFGGKNGKADYYLNGVRLGKGEVQRDLGVLEH